MHVSTEVTFSSKISRNSEAFASEFLDNFEEAFVGGKLLEQMTIWTLSEQLAVFKGSENV